VAEFLQNIDENNKNITEKIIKCFGRNNDWHGRKFSSKDFKKKSLTFEFWIRKNLEN